MNYECNKVRSEELGVRSYSLRLRQCEATSLKEGGKKANPVETRQNIKTSDQRLSGSEKVKRQDSEAWQTIDVAW